MRVSCAHVSQAPPPPVGASGQWERSVRVSCAHESQAPPPPAGASGQSQLCAGVTSPSPSGWCERSVRVSCAQESQAPPPPAGASSQWESAVRRSHRPLPLRLVRAVSECQLCPVKSARVTGPSPSGWCERSVRVSCAHESQAPPPPAGASGQWESAVRTSHRPLPLRLVRAVSESQLCARVIGPSPSAWCERSARVSCAHESQAPPPPAGASGQWESAVRTSHRPLPLRLVRAVSESQLCAVKSARVTGPSPSGWCERSVRVSCAYESQAPPPPAGASGQWESAVCSEERTSHRPLPLRLVRAVSESQLCLW